MAADLAERYGAQLVLLSAFRDGPGSPPRGGDEDPEREWAHSSPSRVREMLARTEAGVGRRGLECRTVVDEGDPGEVLVRLAGECNADVLVIGNKGMHRRVLGSVPNTVTHKADCSVLVVKTT